MNRIRNAWRALMGAEPEAIEYEVEVEVIANVEEVDLYKLKPNRYTIIGYDADVVERMRTHHLTCEAAFQSMPEKDRFWLSVERRKAVRIGNRYFSADAELTVKKPKKAKGSK